MKTVNYEIKDFFKTFAEDRKVFGEELTIGIYEDFFSFFANKKVRGLDKISKIIDEDGYLKVDFSEEDLIKEGLINENGEAASGLTAALKNDPRVTTILPTWLTKFIDKGQGKYTVATKLDTVLNDKTKFEKMRKELTKRIPEGQTNKFSLWLRKARNSIVNFFKGGSVLDNLKKGFSWLTNPANATKVFGTAGGALLVILLMRSLKKRRQLKKYKNLNDLYERSSGIREDANYITNDLGLIELIEEANVNEKIYDLLYNEVEEDKPFKNFDY